MNSLSESKLVEFLCLLDVLLCDSSACGLKLISFPRALTYLLRSRTFFLQAAAFALASFLTPFPFGDFLLPEGEPFFLFDLEFARSLLSERVLRRDFGELPRSRLAFEFL